MKALRPLIVLGAETDAHWKRFAQKLKLAERYPQCRVRAIRGLLRRHAAIDHQFRAGDPGDSSDARNSTPLAMSSAVPSRPIGVRSISSWRTAGR